MTSAISAGTSTEMLINSKAGKRNPHAVSEARHDTGSGIGPFTIGGIVCLLAAVCPAK
ncbi:MAG: hypothetical protein ACPG6X_08070 [Synechococcus sp.]